MTEECVSLTLQKGNARDAGPSGSLITAVIKAAAAGRHGDDGLPLFYSSVSFDPAETPISTFLAADLRQTFGGKKRTVNRAVC